jgi:hypothetical protein
MSDPHVSPVDTGTEDLVQQLNRRLKTTLLNVALWHVRQP